jgi:hypothetical protein
MKGSDHPKKKRVMAQVAVGEGMVHKKQKKSIINNNDNGNVNDNALLKIPADCLTYIIGFVDFDSLLWLRVTSSSMKQTVSQEMMQRAMAVLPMTRETHNCFLGHPRTVRMTLTRGWSEPWTTRRGLVTKALEHVQRLNECYCPPGTIDREVTQRQQTVLERTNRAIFAGDVYWKVAIETATSNHQSLVPGQVWEKMVEMFRFFWDREGAWEDWPEEQEIGKIRDNLRPMTQTLCGILVQAKKSSLVFKQVSYEQRDDAYHSWEEGHESVVLFQTQNGQRFQLESHSSSAQD